MMEPASLVTLHVMLTTTVKILRMRNIVVSCKQLGGVRGGGGGGGSSVGRASEVRSSWVRFPLWPPTPYWLGRCQFNVTG